MRCVRGAGRPQATQLGAGPGTEKANRAKGGKFGTKLLRIVQRIEAIDPAERILVFVQFPDLMQKVADALADTGIKALQVRDGPHDVMAGLVAVAIHMGSLGSE